MKILQKLSLLSAAIAVLSAVSCVNEPFSGEGQEADGPIASVEQQIVYVKSSASLISSVQTGIDKMVEEIENDDLAASLETLYDEFTNRGDALEDHIGFLRNGASWLEATMATLEQQKALAYVNGALYAAVDKEELKVAFESHLKAPLAELAESADKWIGASYETYYSVAQTAGTLEYLLTLAGRQLGDDKGGLEGLLSDVEAGLRDGAEPSEFKTLISVVDGNASALEQLHATVQSVVAELEAEYAKAFEAALSGSGDYSAKTLKKANTKASAELQDATTSLNDLVARIDACETAIEELKARVDKLDADVDELLGMIQSLTFVSEYSDDKAVAYYRMTDTINPDRSAEGKKDRIPEETFNLTFLVRPAAVAEALAQTWQESLSVIGYYANSIQLQKTSDIQEFEIVSAVSTASNGLLTVTVNNAFDDDFYFKEKGAKLALSVESGKNDCTSKFIEIVPRDITGKVYAESLELTPTTLSIQDGDTYKLVAKVTPSNVTDKGFVWNDYGSDYLSVDENGLLTAKAVGSSEVMVTANATDEFGRSLTATCNVTVTPAIKIVGPQSIEIGKSATLKIESPNYINPDDVTWELEWAGNSAYLDLTDNKDATCTIKGILRYFGIPSGAGPGAAQKYLPINVTCKIEGNSEPIVINHSVCVIEVQPQVIAVQGLANDENKMSLKIGEKYQFNTSILPDDVNMDFFKIVYQSGASGVATIDFDGGFLTAVSYGTANISLQVLDKTSESYFFPERELFQKFERVVAVTVEPYWVETMTLPTTYKMAPDATATLTPEWTSDVSEKLPSDQSLTWSSSDPSVVSVDETSGTMTAHKEGTATITATTAGERSVPAGQEQISSSCLVTVETPTVPINIGDYYYDDGTWSTVRNEEKNVIGIVFAKVDATGSDLKLREARPTATHGLVVSIKEYNENMGYISYMDTFFWDNKYDLSDDSKVLGYTYTWYMNQFASSKGDSMTYDTYIAELFRSDVGVVAKHTAEVSSPASPWYVPSCYEMSLMYSAKASVNSSLAAIGATQISDTGYWMSNSVRLYKTSRYWDPSSGQLFDMGAGQLGASLGQFGINLCAVNYPVRVVLAF